jgi:hypothetical protein
MDMHVPAEWNKVGWQKMPSTHSDMVRLSYRPCATIMSLSAALSVNATKDRTASSSSSDGSTCAGAGVCEFGLSVCSVVATLSRVVHRNFAVVILLSLRETVSSDGRISSRRSRASIRSISTNVVLNRCPPPRVPTRATIDPAWVALRLARGVDDGRTTADTAMWSRRSGAAAVVRCLPSVHREMRCQVAPCV